MKLCCFCKHMDFNYEKASGGGCDTCGYGDDEGRTDMVCQKKHWNIGIAWGLTGYREKIKAAETCPDYEQATD